MRSSYQINAGETSDATQPQSPAMPEAHLPSVFLSISGEDLGFAEQVQENVIEGLCEIYTRSFLNAEELLSAMEKRVRLATLFVLLVSKASLKSSWVNFELDAARLQKILRSEFQVIVFPAASDGDFDVADLPSWMRQFWSYRHGRTPKDIGRYINSTIIDGILKPKIFGRGDDLDRAEARFGECDLCLCFR